MSNRRRIGLRDIRVLSPGRTIWDTGVIGFGARRQRGDAVAYFLFYRTNAGRQRWHTIGRHGAPWTPDTARQEAKRLLGIVAAGGDPSADKAKGRNAVTVGELCDRYLEDAEAGRLLTRRGQSKKASTLATDRGRIQRHIKPLIGQLPVASVTPKDVSEFMHAVAEGRSAKRERTGRPRGVANVRGGRGAATRTLGLLGAIFAYGGLGANNPVHGIRRFPDGKVERRLGDDEYRLLGHALQIAEAGHVWPPAVAAARFLTVTGWRRGEVLGLRWSDVDVERRIARLGDTKTGPSVRLLSRIAADILRGLPRTDELVFPATRGDGRMAGFPKMWGRILSLGGLPLDITPHVLRHSFASIAADLGYSEITIAALLGHRQHTVTSRYTHSADAVLLAAADAVAQRIDLLLFHPALDTKVIGLAG